MDAPTAIVTLPSLAALVVLLLMEGPAAHAVGPSDAHVRTACVHGETHNGESIAGAKLFQAASD